jgi:predicted nucleotidyltransferase component of viral defense system
LSDNPTLEELLEVQQHFGLPSPALVEKDWYVIKALAAINAVDAKPFRLVFGGGAALSRAHGLTRRMSEDIDLKIVGEKQSRRPLSRLRDRITNALLGASFEFDATNEAHCKSMYKSRYTLYQLLAKGEGALRPWIQIETAMWPLRRSSVELPVISFIADAFKRPPELATIACAAIIETAAEKFVALTRRAGAVLAGLRERDPTLVRHLYDLHIIRERYDAADFAVLAREIMLADAETYGDGFPAYRSDPLAATLLAVEGIAADASFTGEYDTFRRDMVYGEAPDFETAIATLKAMGEMLKTEHA